MRSILTILLCGLLVTTAFAQKKPKLASGEKALSAGDYATARDIADQASEYEKLKDSPKTWFLRARVYMAIDTSGTDLVDDPMAEAMASFAKAKEMDGYEKLSTPGAGGLGLPVFFDQHISNYWTYYFNEGATAYGNEDFESAVASFEKAQVVNPEDSNAYTNAALAAHNSQMWDAAIRNYEGAIAKGVKSRDIFELYMSVLIAEKKDYDKGLEVIRKAQEVFVGDREFARSEINLLIQMGKTEEARSNIEAQLAEDPNNTNYHFIYGVLLEESGDPEGAKAAYKKAIEVDGSNYNANFNLGVLLINEATEVIKESNNLGITDADLKKAEELEPVIDQKLRDALPQWERVHELQPDDETGMTTLRYIYLQLKMTDEAEVIQGRIEAAGIE